MDARGLLHGAAVGLDDDAVVEVRERGGDLPAEGARGVAGADVLALAQKEFLQVQGGSRVSHRIAPGFGLRA